MSDKMSEVDWASDEAVVRAAMPEVFFTKNGCVWDSELGLRKAWIDFPHDATKSCHLLGRSWKRARHESSVVQAFERENRPVREVEAAKKAVLAVHPRAYCDKSPIYAWRVWNQPISNPCNTRRIGCGESEDSAWLDAASKLTPAAVAEDAMNCGKFAGSLNPRLGLSFACALKPGHDGDCQRGGTCFKHGAYIGENCPSWPSCVASLTSDADPVGVREGEAKECEHYWVSDPDSGAHCDNCGIFFDVSNASLASKQSAEGIPERPKATGNFGGNLACNVHDVYSYCDKVEAIISAKNADIARLTAESIKEFNDSEDQMAELVQRAEASKAELAQLKLSSARIEEDTLRKAAERIQAEPIFAGPIPEEIWNKTKKVLEGKGKREITQIIARASAVCERKSTLRILSPTPTSPESQEEEV